MYFPKGTQHGFGRVLGFPKQEGSEVVSGDVVVEVESGPSSILEVQTSHDGKVAKFLHKKGDPVREGDALVELHVSIADYARGWWKSLEIDMSLPKR